MTWKRLGMKDWEQLVYRYEGHVCVRCKEELQPGKIVYLLKPTQELYCAACVVNAPKSVHLKQEDKERE